MKIIIDPPSGYLVWMDHIAISKQPLETSSLVTCIGLAITQGDQKLLAHVTVGGSPEDISQAIQRYFDISQPMQVSLINGSLESPDTVNTTKVCIKALQMAGVEADYDFPQVKEGPEGWVYLLDGHEIRSEHQIIALKRIMGIPSSGYTETKTELTQAQPPARKSPRAKL